MTRLSGKLKIPTTVSGDPELANRQNAIIIENAEAEFNNILAQLNAIVNAGGGGNDLRKLHTTLKSVKEVYFSAQRERNQNFELLLAKWKMRAIIELTNLDNVSADLDDDSLKKTPWDFYLDVDNEGNPKSEEVITN